MYLYGKVWPTLRELATALDCKRGLRLTSFRKRRLIINWGRANGEEIFRGCANVLNRNIITNKYRQLEILKDAEVCVPEFWKVREGLRDLPVLLRKFSHKQGNDIIYIPEGANHPLTDHDYVIKYIKKKGEYRVHVLGGEVVCITKKKRIEDEEQDDIVWNHQKGWKQIKYRNGGRYYEALSEIGIASVGAMGYDFGAVDVIVGPRRRLYVLEVNSAPGLIEDRVELYADYFRRQNE